jgi:hypothetical protein
MRFVSDRAAHLVRPSIGTRLRRTGGAAVAMAFAFQNFAWAVCADGTNFPAGGYVIGTPPVQTAKNFNAPGFTEAASRPRGIRLGRYLHFGAIIAARS